MEITYHKKIYQVKSTKWRQIIAEIDPALIQQMVGCTINGVLETTNRVVPPKATLTVLTADDLLIKEATQQTAVVLCAVSLQKWNPKVIIHRFVSTANSFYVDFESKVNLKASDLPFLTKQYEALAKANTSIKLSKNILQSATIQLPQQENIALLSTQLVKYVVLENVAGVYIDKANTKMIQRVFGYAALSKPQLLEMQATKKNQQAHDHRHINKQMHFYMFSEQVGQGLPLLLPKAAFIKNKISHFCKTKERAYGFVEVDTPILGKVSMYQQSGHLAHYADDMFGFMKAGNEELMLRPMACPHHIAIYQRKPRTYNELPLRYFEHAILHRYEASGALSGLERVRKMELTDAHLFVRFDQIKAEMKNCFALIQEVLNYFPVEIAYYSLSVRDDNKDKYYQDDVLWNKAEALLAECLDELNVSYQTLAGEAAFYGPKIDFQIKTALNHELTLSTLQLDFVLPTKFDLKYLDEQQNQQTPIMIHRGLIGTFERFLAFLIEQTSGYFPLWLAPIQIVIVPVNQQFHQACDDLQTKLTREGFRVELDKKDERFNYKIRHWQTEKIPFIIIFGQAEANNHYLSVREYYSNKTKQYLYEEFVSEIKTALAKRSWPNGKQTSVI